MRGGEARLSRIDQRMIEPALLHLILERPPSPFIASGAALVGIQHRAIVVHPFGCLIRCVATDADRTRRNATTHSTPTCPPFSATERLMSSTTNATTNVNTAIIQKLSK